MSSTATEFHFNFITYGWTTESNLYVTNGQHRGILIWWYLSTEHVEVLRPEHPTKVTLWEEAYYMIKSFKRFSEIINSQHCLQSSGNLSFLCGCVIHRRVFLVNSHIIILIEWMLSAMFIFFLLMTSLALSRNLSSNATKFLHRTS